MERVTTYGTLGRSEAEALAYFAMGVTSEGSLNGRNVAYRLSFAGRILKDGRLDPTANSGYSIGTIQTDLGQHPAAALALTAAYRDWSSAQPEPRPIAADDATGWTELERMLSRDGHAIRREGGRDLMQGTKADIQRFLASDDGVDFIHARDVAQIDRLLRPDSTQRRSALHSISDTGLYRDADPDDRIRLAAIFLKLENQSGRSIYPGMINRIQQGELDSLDAVKQALDGRAPYISTGMHHALSGTEAYMRLRSLSPENPLAEATRKVMDAPLVRPTSLTDQGSEIAPSAAEYATVKAMFLRPATAVEFLGALDRGASFAEGRPDRTGSGFFASGNDFAYWDGTGHGHASIAAHWHELDRRGLRRVNHHDGRVDLLQRTAKGEEPLLRIDRTEPPLRANPSSRLDPALHDQVRVLHQATGVAVDDPTLERITASLMQATTAAGLRHVRHLVASNGRLLAWEGDPRDPAIRWSSISLEHAARTPVEASLAGLSRADQPDYALHARSVASTQAFHHAARPAQPVA